MQCIVTYLHEFMKGLFLLFLAFLALSLSGRNVNLEFLSPTDRYAYDLASFQGINSLSFRIVTDSSGAEYDLVAVQVWPDSVVERHVGLLPVRLHTDTMELRLLPIRHPMPWQKYSLP